MIGIICFLIVVCLSVGIGMNCKSDNSEKETILISNKETASSVAESSVSTEKAETDTEESEKESKSEPKNSEKAFSTSKKVETTTEKVTKRKTKSTTTTKKSVQSGTVHKEKPPVKTTEKTTKTQSITVSFSVNCEKAAQYGADYPKYLISHTKCDVKDGTTVFDLLSEECSKNGISVVHQNKSYVKAIGGLSEKDCGNGSGWIYKVNGVKPMMSASKYVLKNGDVVEWYYVTSPAD